MLWGFSIKISPHEGDGEHTFYLKNVGGDIWTNFCNMHILFFSIEGVAAEQAIPLAG